MKRMSLILLGVVAVAGLVVWSQRFERALEHVREKSASPGDRPSSVAWAILGDFADRPELEAFVREQLVAAATTVVGTEAHGELDHTPLLGLSRDVYKRQPERVDAEVVAAALVVECVNRCSSGGYDNAPTFETFNWSEETKASDTFKTGMRLAALALAKYGPGSSSTHPTESFASLATTLAAGVPVPDPELAASVAAFIVAAKPGVRETGWLTDALDRIAGPDGIGTAWATALAAPTVDLPVAVWDAAVDALRRSPPPSEEPLGEALLAHCVRLSNPPASVDEGCIDLGLAWGAAWTTLLRTAASRERPDADVVRALLSTHQRESARTWQSVIADWRGITPPTPDGSSDAGRGRRRSAMNTSAYQPAFQRRDARDIALLLEAGSAAFPAVAAQYRAARHPDIVTASAFVLTKGAPELLSSAVMDRIEHFRPLAYSFLQDRFDAAAYALEGSRVAVGLLALGEHGNRSTRIHPLILALSIPERGFSEYASATLRKTLSSDEFADALFGFLAVRKSYLVVEVDAYREALLSYEGVSPAIERNLTRLLTAARGRPERVAWILKVIGLSALGRVGGASARPVLGQYAEDTESYLEFSTESDDPEDAVPIDPVEKRFDALVACALHEIDVREGGATAGSSALACAPGSDD